MASFVSSGNSLPGPKRNCRTERLTRGRLPVPGRAWLTENPGLPGVTSGVSLNPEVQSDGNLSPLPPALGRACWHGFTHQCTMSRAASSGVLSALCSVVVAPTHPHPAPLYPRAGGGGTYLGW